MEITAAAVFHDETVELVGFEVGVKIGKKRMIKETQNLSLVLSSDELVPVSQRSLVHHLHGEESIGTLELDEVNTPDITVPDPL